MAFMTLSRVVERLLPHSKTEDAALLRDRPELVRLDPDPDVEPSGKPPVRIFVGTEPGQYRAERVLVWSVERHRDRSRAYEIYLMKDLAGFDRRLWLTGFTNYRFAIPHLAGGEGRAIYNDVDQQYLADPAELFDMDMGEAGFLALSPDDTAVMLIDCARMRDVWTLAEASGGRRKPLEAKARHLWGQLPPEWHCRDWEYVEGRSKCMHYTTIHTQPWQPFPDTFVYQRNDVAHVWERVEREANEAGYEPFTLARPSLGFRAVVAGFQDDAQRQSRDGAGNRAHRGRTAPVSDRDRDLDRLAEATGATEVLHLRIGGARAHGAAADGLAERRRRFRLTEYDGREPLESDRTFDGVLCTDTLEHVSDDDVYWLLADLFARARRFVRVEVRQGVRNDVLTWLGRNRRSRREPAWWYDRMREAGRRHRDVHWQIALAISDRRGRTRIYQREGGRRLNGPPRVWVLVDHKPGHTTQSLGLANALKWPYELKPVPFYFFQLATDRLLGPLALDVDGSRADVLAPPWPDVVISTGWRTAPISRWIAEQSGGRTRTVQMGRKGGDVAHRFDAVVTPSHLRLPIHPHRVETIAPLNRVTADELGAAAERWQGLFGTAPKPHIVLLVGGTSASHRLDAAVATRMGDDVARLARESGGTVFAVTSRRTGTDVEAALEAGLGATGRMCRWSQVGSENPYLGYLALADAIVVTSDSESMLAEAVATGKPVYIYPVPRRPLPLSTRFARLVADVAYSRPRKRKGTIRPQQGREYLCSRLIERGIVRPPHDVDAMCQALIERGVARRFGEPLVLGPVAPLREAERAADQVRALLGWTAWEGTPVHATFARRAARAAT